MKISGTKVAEQIREDLKPEIEKLKSRGITPKVAIVTLGAEGAWEAYVRQKLKVAAELGLIAEFINLKDARQEELLKKIDEINQDKSFHGIIAQRPMPGEIDKTTVTNAIDPIKDIDGFRDDSPYKVPVWLATKKLIEVSLAELGIKKSWNELNFVILGKGETAGAPAIKELTKLGVNVNVVDSKTQSPDEVIRSADIIISSVGKSRVINSSNIKRGAILIGVGTHTEDGKLKGDYDAEDIENIAASYTPTPFGVGPVNLTYLFINLVDAAKKQAE